MRLHVSDHAFIRAADWHPELQQFVPRRLVLDFPQAQGILNFLHVFVASLENGRPATRSEAAKRRLAQKYHRTSTLFIFDRPLQDLYTLVMDHRGLTLVTMTAISDEHADQMLDEPAPQVRFSEVDEIRLPYVLECGLQGDPEFLSLRTPAGRELRLSYDIDFTPMVGAASGSSRGASRHSARGPEART